MNPYAKNPRRISDDQFKDLEQWLRELGDLSGIVHDLNSDQIIGGNQRSRVFDVNKCQIEIVERYEAPDAQGTVAFGFVIWEGNKYTYRQVRWTAKQCEQANIVANKAGGDWDIDKLLTEFEKDDLLDWGFQPDELALPILVEDDEPHGEDPLPKSDLAKELGLKWGTATGQLWTFGPHRLIVGDSKDPRVIARLMAGKIAEVVWTDPPYGVSIGAKNEWLTSLDKNNRVLETMENDELDEGDLRLLLTAVFDNALAVCKPGGAWYVCAPPGPLFLVFGQALHERGIWRQTLQWVKQNATFAPMGVDYHWQQEPIFYGWKPGGAHFYQGGRTQTTVWNIDRPGKSPEHPTMKPVELVERALANSSRKGSIVLDPFLGSGTTMAAAHRLDRIAYGVEFEPNYAAVIVQRMVDMGLDPVLAEAAPVIKGA